LNVDDDFRFTQFFTEMLILATQLLVLFVEGRALALGTTLLWSQRVQDPCGTLMPPRRQMRGVQALAPQQGANAAGLPFSLVGFGKDRLLVLASEDATLRSGYDLGVGCPAMTPAASLRSALVPSMADRTGISVFAFFMLNFLPALHSN